MWSNKNNVFWHVEWSVRIAYCHCRCPNTKTQLLRLCLSAACFVLCCVRVCVCLRLASHDLWKWFVTCGGPEDTTLNHIDCSSYYILLFPFFFFFVTWQDTFSHLKAALAFLLLWRFVSCGIDLSRAAWCGGGRERKEGEGELLIFFESECGSIICFLEGVVQKQPAGEPCLLYLIGTESVTPWLKKPQWKHSAHTNTHTLSFHVCFENPLFLFTSFTHLVEST